jgi:metallo-beta-lactamase class B
VKVDQRIADGEVLNLGGVAVTVHLHAGHTKGSASYSLTAHEGNRDYWVLIANIGSINHGVRLIGSAKYPRIAEDLCAKVRTAEAIAVGRLAGVARLAGRAEREVHADAV